MVTAISGVNIGLTVFGAVDPRLGNKIYPSGDNIDFGYWRSFKNDNVTSGSGIFNQLYIPFDGTGVKRTSKPEVFDRVSKTAIISSGGHWEKAGDGGIEWLDNRYTERALYLNDHDYLIAGSGKGLAYSNKFTVYANLMPSGSTQLNHTIISKYDQNPAQMVLGIDSDGLYYVRADGETDEGENKAYYAKSNQQYDLYEQPTQVIGVFGYTSAGSGDATKNSLALYVNSVLQQDISARFNRKSPENRRSDDIVIGKPEFGGADGYRGWITEAGVADYVVTPSGVARIRDNTFGLSNFINEGVGASGAYNFSFGQAFDAMDTNYIEFVVDSGNHFGQLGGAFDNSLWGNKNYAVSSQIYFDMDALRPDAYQVTDNLYVDMWIKHETNHFSGAYLQPYISIERDHDTAYNDLHWKGETFFLPSSVRKFQNLRFSAPLTSHPASGANVFHQDGKREFRTDFNFHELNLSLSYPSGTSEATTAEFRRNKSFQSSFKVYSAKVNVDAFVIPSTGIEDLWLYTTGDTSSSKTGSADLFLDAKSVVGNIDLYLKNDITKLKGSGLLSTASLISTTKAANLYTKAGIADDLRLGSLNLVMASGQGERSTSSSIDLFMDSAQFGTSGVKKQIDLFLDVAESVPAASGFFALSGTVNLFHQGGGVGRIGHSVRKTTADDGTRITVTDYYHSGNVDLRGRLNEFSRPLVTLGRGDSDTIAAYSRTSDSIDLFVKNAYRAVTNDIPLYAKTVSASTHSGTLNLFLLRKSGVFKQTELFLKGPYPSGTISMFNIGHTIKSSSISLYASGLGTLTNSSTPLVAKGYIAQP